MELCHLYLPIQPPPDRIPSNPAEQGSLIPKQIWRSTNLFEFDMKRLSIQSQSGTTDNCSLQCNNLEHCHHHREISYGCAYDATTL
jgi:hypothetical protein